MNVLHEFSRFAKHYDSYNIIQNRVAKSLVSMVSKSSYSTVIDMGCGSGVIYRNFLNSNIEFSNFIALDFSEEMLSQHPSSKNIQKLSFDFNCIEDFKQLNRVNNQLIISSSALQWSKNIELTLKEISSYGEEFYFSFFTSNTFYTLHKIANIKSPIHTKKVIFKALDKYYSISYEIKKYQLNFKSVRLMLQYIKKSGVNGKGNRLRYSEVKRIMRDYPYNYLEFEVLFVKAVPRDQIGLCL